MHDPDGVAELDARTHQVIELAKAAGASDVFVTASRSREVETEMREGTLEKVQEATQRSISVNLWVNGRFGGHSTSDLRPDQLEAFLAQAVALTAALQPDEHRTITDPEHYEGRSTADLDLLDPAVASLTSASRAAMLTQMQEGIASTGQLISGTSGVYDGVGTTVAASSNGFHGVRQSSWITLGTEVTLQGEGDKRPEDGMWVTARHLEDLLDPGEVAAEAARWATVRLGSTKGATAKTTMIVHPRAGSRLLGRLVGPATGSSVQQGRSMWADRIGTPAISAALTLVDDPLVVRGLRSRHFDGEGIAARAMTLFEGGALQSLYLDTTYASKLGMAPTTEGPSNLIVAPGARDLEGLIGATSDGILVTSWLGGNMDSTTGDFSFGVRGIQIRKGARGGSVGEMNVTGNMLDLFSHLVEVGNDPWPWRSTRCPTLVFDGVQFSGT